MTHRDVDMPKLTKSYQEQTINKTDKISLFHEDNAPTDNSLVSMDNAHDCGFELVYSPISSPDLVSIDYHLFTHIKTNLAGRQYQTDDDDISFADVFLPTG